MWNEPRHARFFHRLESFAHRIRLDKIARGCRTVASAFPRWMSESTTSAPLCRPLRVVSLTDGSPAISPLSASSTSPTRIAFRTNLTSTYTDLIGARNEVKTLTKCGRTDNRRVPAACQLSSVERNIQTAADIDANRLKQHSGCATASSAAGESSQVNVDKSHSLEPRKLGNAAGNDIVLFDTI
jgi:hypothetical protein